MGYEKVELFYCVALKGLVPGSAQGHLRGRLRPDESKSVHHSGGDVNLALLSSTS